MTLAQQFHTFLSISIMDNMIHIYEMLLCISFTISLILMLFIYYLKHLEYYAGPNVWNMLGGLRRRHQNYILFPLLTFIHFLLLFYSLAFACLQFLQMSTLFCLFWTYIWSIQWRCSFCVHILSGLLSCDSSRICKKCCVFAHCYTFDDELE